MATFAIEVSDSLLTLYAEARSSWNPTIAGQGGTLLPAPTKTALAKVLTDIMKDRVLGAALLAGKSPDEVDALQEKLNGL